MINLVAQEQPRTHRLLDWSATTLPVSPVLFVGVLLGPHGLAILTSRALAAVDPATPVALTVLGALLGLERGAVPRMSRRFDLLGSAYGLLTMLVVGAGLYVTGLWGEALISPPWLLPAACGVCAASSVTLASRAPGARQHVSDALMESEVTLTVVAAAALLVALHPTGAVNIVLLQSVGIAALLAAAGWLLVQRTTSTTERRVFVLATLLLVGGSADLLSASPVLAGLVAGVLWQQLGEPSRETLYRETLYVQHPFVVLVLLAAGARTEWSALTIAFGVIYATLRALTRFVAGTWIQRFTGTAGSDFRLRLVTPGMFGVALALNVARAAGADVPGASATLSVVVIGTLLSDLLARFAAPRGGAACVES